MKKSNEFINIGNTTVENALNAIIQFSNGLYFTLLNLVHF